MGFALCHSSGAQNFKVAPRFFEHLCTPGLMKNKFCLGPVWPQMKIFVTANMCCLTKLAVISLVPVEGAVNKRGVFFWSC
jgi:hypothetical protein